VASVLKESFGIRAYQRGNYKGIYTPKIAKMDLTSDAEYVANFVNLNMWL